MTDETRGGAPGAETSDIGAPGVLDRERCMTARRKQEAVARRAAGDGGAGVPGDGGRAERVAGRLSRGGRGRSEISAT
jgi:hypothetical protein